MLHKLNSKTISFAEMRDAATKLRGMQVVKGTFTKMTGCTNWNEAAMKFPNHAVEEQLKAFTGLSFKGGLPDVFKEYCRAAMTSQEDVESGSPGQSTVTSPERWITSPEQTCYTQYTR